MPLVSVCLGWLRIEVRGQLNNGGWRLTGGWRLFVGGWCLNDGGWYIAESSWRIADGLMGHRERAAAGGGRGGGVLNLTDQRGTQRYRGLSRGWTVKCPCEHEACPRVVHVGAGAWGRKSHAPP